MRGRGPSPGIPLQKYNKCDSKFLRFLFSLSVSSNSLQNLQYALDPIQLSQPNTVRRRFRAGSFRRGLVLFLRGVSVGFEGSFHV